MKFSNKVNNRLQKFLLCGVAAVSLITINTIAFAEPGSVYVLQLGSFDSKEQAEQKWQELKAKNPDALGKLTLHISEISMTGDNKVTYRTQAGPVESHEKASDICGKLFQQGNECYVVETAMFAQEPLPENAASSTVTEVKPAEAEKVTTVYTPPQQQGTSVQLSQGDQTVPGRGPQFLDTTPQQTNAPAAAAEPAQAPAVTAVPAYTSAAPRPQTQQIANDDDYESPAAERNSNSFLFGRTPKHHTAVTQTATEQPTPEPTPVASASKSGFFGWFGSSKPAPTPVPVTVAPVAPVAVATVQAPPAPAAEPVGNVNVAEAIRVPLTRDNSTMPPQTVVVAPPGTPLMNMPAPDSNGVYWAQINYFADEASAHNFYEEFRNAYPDISDGIRMRITRPYAYANTRGRVTLRMGTFAQASDIRAICAMASHQNLNCISVKDASPLGAGSSYLGNKAPENLSSAFPSVSASSSGGHFLDAAPQHVDTVAYWVQFGSFGSYDDAMDKWKDIQKSNKKLLSKLRPSISEPEMSSYERKVFRLRTGPFNNRGIADSLCDKLSTRGESCIVLGENPLFN